MKDEGKNPEGRKENGEGGMKKIWKNRTVHLHWTHKII